METFLDFVQTWGYVAVLLGSMIEGESVILTASFLAYQGYMSLPKIMIIAFFGTLIADQGLYQLGYRYGPSFLKRFPKMKDRSERAFSLLHKWDFWYILTFRFIYGIRIISPVVIGAAHVSPWRFIPLNLLAAVIWTVVSCVGGYLLGDTVQRVIENFDVIQRYIVFVFIGIIVLGIVLYKFVFKRKATNNDKESRRISCL